MKLSHILVATLVSSSITVSAQTEPKTSKTPKSKSKTKTLKQKTKPTVCKVDTLNLNVSQRDPHYCPACGRG